MLAALATSDSLSAYGGHSQAPFLANSFEYSGGAGVRGSFLFIPKLPPRLAPGSRRTTIIAGKQLRLAIANLRKEFASKR